MTPEHVTIRGKTNPFLTIFTMSYLRPKALAVNQASLDGQTCDDWEQIILADTAGMGYPWVAAQMREHAGLATGAYVMYMDDDDYLASPAAVAGLRNVARGKASPDVIVRLMDYVSLDGERYLLPEPDYWGRAVVVYGHIGGQCLIAKREIWLTHIGDMRSMPEYGHAADFPFVSSVLNPANGYRVHWWEDTLVRMQSRGKGQPEATHE